eukprot:scaffold3648_cov149-Amphora_coffeaeformis.AAC.2
MEQPFPIRPSATQAASDAMKMQRQQAALRLSAVAAHKGQSNQMRNSHQIIRSDGYPYLPAVYYGGNHSMNACPLSTGHHHSSGDRHPFPPVEAYTDGGSHRYMMSHHGYYPHPPGMVFPSKHRHARRYPTVAPHHPEKHAYESTHGRCSQTVESHPSDNTVGEEPNPLPPTNKHGMVLPPPSRPPLVNRSVRSGEGREVRNLPLQTVVPNKGKMETPIAKKSVNMDKSSRQTNNGQENRGAVMKFIKSPVTMCFERMLGAANYLATNPTPDHVKKQLARKSMGSVVESTDTQESKSKLKRKSMGDESVGNETTVEGQSEHKRVRGLKPFLISSEEAEKLNQLGENNPFVQLLNDEELYHQVILLMTLEAETKEVKRQSESDEPVSSEIGEGFKWRDYPQLEQMLYDKMGPYYSISVTSRQSKQQQQFNNQMVASIREAAAASGCSFWHGVLSFCYRNVYPGRGIDIVGCNQIYPPCLEKSLKLVCEWEWFAFFSGAVAPVVHAMPCSVLFTCLLARSTTRSYLHLKFPAELQVMTKYRLARRPRQEGNVDGTEDKDSMMTSLQNASSPHSSAYSAKFYFDPSLLTT